MTTNTQVEELRKIFTNIATYNELIFHEKDRACPICGIKPLTMFDLFTTELNRRKNNE